MLVFFSSSVCIRIIPFLTEYFQGTVYDDSGLSWAMTSEAQPATVLEISLCFPI